MSIPRSASPHLTFAPPGPGATFAHDESGIIGCSAVMKRLRQQVRRIGPHFRTVLVCGEAGTGKELVARALHRISPAAEEPFVVHHAAAIGDALAEFESGARTGDDGRSLRRPVRKTLFLERINNMPLEAQGRLLRVLMQHESAQSRINAPKRMEMRIISSTEEDLKILVSTGRFNQELYRRLATVDITLPPLRERMEDLPELARYFLERFAAHYGRGAREIAAEAMERMQKHPWPRNVSELESVLRNSVLRCGEEVLEPHHLPSLNAESRPEQPAARTTKSLRLQDVIEQHVLRVLKDCGGNKLRASELLGISRSTLYRMLDSGVSAESLR